jgi:hypothetical protein
MIITPELAQEWLDRGGTNRKITRRCIEAMTATIQRGEWRLTGEAIKLDHEGRVRDGQNRLHAIVEAGIPVQSVVARGVSEDAFDVMDTGRSRNAADVLHIHGYPSQNVLAAAARGLMFVERYGRVFPSQRDSHLYVTPMTTLVRPGAPRDRFWRPPGRPHLPQRHSRRDWLVGHRHDAVLPAGSGAGRAVH